MHSRGRDSFSRAGPSIRGAACKGVSNMSPEGGLPRSHSLGKTYTIQIVSYDRGHHPVTNAVQPYHWAILINNGATSLNGTIYQLKGMPGAFHYDGPESNEDMIRSNTRIEEIEIGELPAGRLAEFERIAKDEAISKQEYGWNCQNWTNSVLERLKASGFGHTYITADSVKSWLKEKET